MTSKTKIKRQKKNARLKQNLKEQKKERQTQIQTRDRQRQSIVTITKKGSEYTERGSKIRIWAKFSTHRGDEPLYIEYFIEGFNNDYDRLKKILTDRLDITFNYQGGHGHLISELEDELEFGRVFIEEFSRWEGFVHIAYKHSQNQKWQIQK